MRQFVACSNDTMLIKIPCFLNKIRVMTKQLLPLALTLPFVLSGYAWGAEQSKTLDAVNVTEQKPALPANIPGTTEGITAKRMEDYNVVNTEDALKYSPNLAVRKRYIGDRNSVISVRSTSSRQSARGVVYADGLLLSNFLGSDFGFPPRWSLVAPEEIARVDVMYGPFSALYPGNSLGATVVITTDMPQKFEADAKVQAFSQHFDLYGVNQSFNGNQLSAAIGDKHGAFAYRFSFDHLNNESQPLSFATLNRSTTAASGADIVVNGAYFDKDQFGNNRVTLGLNSEGMDHTIQDQLKFKATYDFTPTLTSLFTVGYWQQDRSSTVGSYLRDTAGNIITNGNLNIDGFRYTIPAITFASSNGEDARWLYGATIKTRNDTGWNIEATASLFDVTKDITRTSNTSESGAGTVAYGNNTGWGTFDIKSDYKTKDSAHWWTFGYHYDLYKLSNSTYNATHWQSESVTSLNSSFFGKTQTQALFIQDAWKFASLWKLIAGARWEQWKAMDGSRTLGTSIVGYDGRSESNTSPKLALEYTPNDNWLFRGSLGKAYRFPTVSELFQGRVVGTSIVNNDPNLKPEDAFSKELSAERFFDSGKLRLSVYEDDVKNVIFSQTNTTVIPNITNIQNLDRVRTRGAEISYDAQNILKNLDVIASIAYNQAITLENANNPATIGKRFYRIPLWRADLLATYHQTPALSYTVAVRYSGRQYNTLDNSDNNPGTFGGTSNYTIYDVKINYQPIKTIKLGFGIDNITDQRYYVFHPLPGRTLFAEAKFSF